MPKKMTAKNETLNCVIYAMGTRGDVHPFIFLAQILMDNKWNVVLLSNQKFSALANKSGIHFEPVTDERIYDRTFNNASMWKKGSGKMHAISYHAPAIEPAYNKVTKLHDSLGLDLVLGGGRLNGAEWAADTLGIPYVKVSLAPSVEDRVIKNEIGRSLSRGVFSICFINLYFLLRNIIFYFGFVRPVINPIRRKLGLKAWGINSPNTKATRSILAMYPLWFTSVNPSHIQNIGFSNFPCFDPVSAEARKKVNEIVARLDRKPVVFTLGTGVYRLGGQLKEADEICRLLETMGVFVGGTIPEEDKEKFRHLIFIDYVDFSYLFGFACAVCHHGGIGTVAQCLSAGVPQIIRPMIFDQPDNARRIESLGVGKIVNAYKYSATEVAEKISSLLGDPLVREKLLDISRRVNEPGRKQLYLDHIYDMLLKFKCKL